MIVKDEAFGEQALEPPWTSLDIEDPVALDTMEMVVVFCGDFRQFIAIWLPRNRHARDLIGFLELSDDAVDRTEAE